MTLQELAQRTPNFTKTDHNEKVKIFAWYLHEHKNIHRFTAANIRKCYNELFLSPPANISIYLTRLEARKPKELLKDSKGYFLEKDTRDNLRLLLGDRDSTVAVTRLLSELPVTVNNLTERTYLDEALICFKHKAYRASIVMSWNLTFHHLLQHILSDDRRLLAFNDRWQLSFQGDHKKAVLTISKMEDFSDLLKESRIIEIANLASIISNNINKILREKLNTRNSAAHPSSVEFGQLQTEEFIDTLIRNVMLKI